MAKKVMLFKTWTSPFSLRVTMALKIKGIECESIIEDLSNKSPLLLQYNPIHKMIPVLVHHDKSMCESLVILEYVDETWKQNPLLPQDPHEKAVSCFWAKFGDEKLLSSVWKVFLTRDEVQEEAIAAALENLKLIEELLKGKKFFNGETIGYLDLALCWMPNVIINQEEMPNMKLVVAERFPSLAQWMQNILNDPILEDCWPPLDKLIAKYKSIRE